MTFPFQVHANELDSRLEELVDSVWKSLQSHFLTLPKGQGFVAYERFASAYYVLQRATRSFQAWTLDRVWDAFEQDRLVFVVVRTMMGLTPPEWAYLATNSQVSIKQGQARSLDRLVREESDRHLSQLNETQVRCLLAAAVEILSQPTPKTPARLLHRFDKVDTSEGIDSIRFVGTAGVPYPTLLYERFLGRPFASHRDSVSEMVGDVMEGAIEDTLTAAGIVYRKTGRAERVPGFEQAPDFIVPEERLPRIVLEAKISEDDGTARDKVTRILYLAALSAERTKQGLFPFQVVACIDGRGFAIRREDMRRLIMATQGKVFTLATISALVDHTGLAEFRTR